MKSSAKKLGAVAGGLVLASSAALGAAPAFALLNAEAPGAPASDQAPSANAGAEAADAFVRVSGVSGSFAYDQSATTSNQVIANVFNKAAAALCDSMPDYGVREAGSTVRVMGDVDNAFESTVQDMADSSGAESYVMACSCASNVPGGGAVANAEVSGVSFASVAAQAQAK